MNDKVKICFEQKKILLVKIMNLTKQLEARSKQPNIHFEDLPQQRQIYIDRIKKCEKLLSTYINELPDDQSNRMKNIMSGNVPKCECEADEQEYFECGAKIRFMLGSIVAMDNEILQNTKKERDKQQRKIKHLRKGINANNFYE